MRRKDKQVSERLEIDAIIRGCQVCHLAMAVDNIPYVVPLCFGYDGTNLYVHMAGSGKKVDCLKANPRVCFQMERGVRLVSEGADPCNWGFHFESVIGSGLAEELNGDEDKAGALGWIVKQYAGKVVGPVPPSAGLRVWRIAIDEISAKRSPPAPAAP
ncbi:MAG: pyridoxamine 5'-phosphate oxidase family protein [Pseudomonadota bacterium]